MAGSLTRGALCGVAATGLMTAVIGIGRLAGLFHTPPPQEVTARVDPKGGRPERWLPAHFGAGAVGGLLYPLVEPALPSRSALAGALYGGAIWAIAYLGGLSALGLYPPPDEDRPSRLAVMFAAHEVYGVSLAVMLARWSAVGRAT